MALNDSRALGAMVLALIGVTGYYISFYADWYRNGRPQLFGLHLMIQAMFGAFVANVVMWFLAL